jgi:hypothetical protein
MLLDHVVLFVDDLEDAVDTFSQQGFTVTPGGVNGPTHNALIAFANETYIELIALQSRKKRLLLRLLGQLGLLKVLRPKKPESEYPAVELVQRIARLHRYLFAGSLTGGICKYSPRGTGRPNPRYCVQTTSSRRHSCFVAIGRRSRLDAAVFY